LPLIENPVLSGEEARTILETLAKTGTAEEQALARETLATLKSCFVAGTPLLTPNGSKPVEEFVEGDLILSRSEFDPEGLVEAKVVEAVFVRTGRIFRIRAGGKEIRTTAEHPFWVAGRGWMEAGLLQPGDELVGHAGRSATVEEAQDTGKHERVYNLRVGDYHTYFVGCQEWGFSIWAHNADYEVFLDAGSNTWRVRNVATHAVIDSPLGAPIEFSSRAQATRWLARNKPNIAVPLSEATLLRPDELATGLRAETQLGYPLYESQHVGADFVDSIGRSYDALIRPGASAHWATEWPQIQRQLLQHLDKVNFTIIDVTGLDAAQIADVTAHVNGLSAAQRAKIIRIGF
jgi:hypothetical protein